MITIKPRIVDEGVFRGSAPTTADDWYILQRRGIKYTLDLETGDILDGNPKDETLTAEHYGIKDFSLPMGRIFPPFPGSLIFAVSFTKFKPIYIHCRQGVDRTGMVCAAYRIAINGWTRAAAIAEMKALGLHVWYFWWAWFL